MTHVTVDDRGRVYLPKDVRDAYGDRYRIARLKGEIKLIPVHEDPLTGLREAFAGIEDVSLDELDGVAERRGRDEAKDALR